MESPARDLPMNPENIYQLPHLHEKPGYNLYDIFPITGISSEI
jgi:hypothetical protein